MMMMMTTMMMTMNASVALRSELDDADFADDDCKTTGTALLFSKPKSLLRPQRMRTVD